MDAKSAKKGYRRRCQLDDVSLFYRELGCGEPVFLLPGFPYSSTSYQPMMQELAPKYKTIAPDLPYWSGRTVAKDFPKTISAYTKLVSKFVKSFGFKKYHVVGYSMGGLITQYAITKGLLKPEKVCLISTFADGSAISFNDWQRKLINMVSLNGIKEYFRGYASFFLMVYMATGSLKELKYFEESFRLKDILEDFLRMDMVESIRLVENAMQVVLDPTTYPKLDYLLIYAQKDYEYIQKQMNYLSMALNTDPVVVPGSGHAHAFFNYKIASRYIKLFLDR